MTAIFVHCRGSPKLPNGSMSHDFTICYGAGRGDFRVYVTGLIGLTGTVYSLVLAEPMGLVFSLPFLCAAFYFYPLLEKKIPRLGANQYGVFLDGFGIIDWRYIKDVSIKTYAVRSIKNEQLEIELSRPVDDCLIKDWRNLPIHRLLMKLPWQLKEEKTIIVALEPFSVKSEEIYTTLRNLMDLYRR